MKHLLTSVLVLAIIAVMISGCGKSAEIKSMEAALNTEVMKLHDDQMGALKQVDDLVGQLDGALAMHDSLVAAHPKEATGHMADDLKGAKEKLIVAKQEINAWMAGHKPYDVNMKHEEVMAQLSKDKDILMKTKGEIESGITGALTAIESHKKAAQELLAKLPKAMKHGRK
jgi:uncharacterized lipoprotein YehR (DUF1307 family)